MEKNFLLVSFAMAVDFHLHFCFIFCVNIQILNIVIVIIICCCCFLFYYSFFNWPTGCFSHCICINNVFTTLHLLLWTFFVGVVLTFLLCLSAFRIFLVEIPHNCIQSWKKIHDFRWFTIQRYLIEVFSSLALLTKFKLSTRKCT